MIFGWLGFPAMGVRGAAVATVIGQTVAGLLALYFNLKKNEDIQLNIKGCRPDFHILKQIYAVGIPSILIQVGGSIMVYAMNRILIVFSSTATAVFGVYFKLQSFVFMPVFGLNSGMMPIVAYNFGAGKRDRLIRAVKLSVIYATAIMAVGFLVFQSIPESLLGFFRASDNMMGIGIPALRIISISYLFAGFNIICGAMFGAMGNGVYSMIIATARQLLVLVPVAYLLSGLGRVEYVWWSFPIAEAVAIALTVIFTFKINHRIIRHIGMEAPPQL
jgi:Na+-driven multidrug efflux pump